MPRRPRQHTHLSAALLLWSATLGLWGCGPEAPLPAPPPTPPPRVTPPTPGKVAKGWALSKGRLWQQEIDTSTGKLLAQKEIFLQGLNWFGMETPDRAPHGLWTGRSIRDFMVQIKQLGFTALRLPLSPEVIRKGFATADWAQKEAKDGRAMLEHVLQEAMTAGLLVILDFHTYDPSQHGGDLPGAPFGGAYQKADWIADLQALAKLAMAHPHVVGIDLCNEPHALDWSAWRALVIEAGKAILAINPRIILVVGGVGGLGDTGGIPVHWGENLTSAGPIPELPASQVWFAPHVYGPDVFAHEYTNAPDFPANMPEIWEKHFGHLLGQGLPLLIGEFGGKYEAGTKDELWHNAFVEWLNQRKVRHFLYWALNPNSGDTGGLLLDDWKSLDERKMTLLRRLLSSPKEGG